MSVPQVSAAQAVGEYLQSPDDLAKVAAFRKKLEKEKASIDTRLKNGVKEQLIATREGLRKLLGTKNNVQCIKDEMTVIDKSRNEPQINVQTFEQISRVSLGSLIQNGDQIIATGIHGASKFPIYRRDGPESTVYGREAR